MLPYWLAFLIPAMAALAHLHGKTFDQIHIAESWDLRWIVVCSGLTLFIGFRFEVGGDWFNYINRLETISNLDLSTILLMPDPGYLFLNWLSNTFDWGIYGTNLIGAAIFAFALLSFCRSQPLPWLALAASVPYLVVVLGMGYTRQGIALGFAMLGLLALRRQDTLRFVVWVVLGALFHKTAVLLLPIAALTKSKNRYWTALWVGVISLGAYLVLLADSVDALYQNYMLAQYQSEGAFVRLSMNALPAVIFLLWRHRFQMEESEISLWSWMSLIAAVLFLLFFVSPSSTAVDRIALYVLPLQLVVFSHLPLVLGPSNGGRHIWVALVVMYYTAVQFVWLNFASHAQYWLPYRFFPFEVI